MEINEAISDKFGLDYLRTCIQQELSEESEQNGAIVATEKGLQPSGDADP